MLILSEPTLLLLSSLTFMLKSNTNREISDFPSHKEEGVTRRCVKTATFIIIRCI